MNTYSVPFHANIFSTSDWWHIDGLLLCQHLWPYGASVPQPAVVRELCWCFLSAVTLILCPLLIFCLQSLDCFLTSCLKITILKLNSLRRKCTSSHCASFCVNIPNTYSREKCREMHDCLSTSLITIVILAAPNDFCWSKRPCSNWKAHWSGFSACVDTTFAGWRMTCSNMLTIR